MPESALHHDQDPLSASCHTSSSVVHLFMLLPSYQALAMVNKSGTSQAPALYLLDTQQTLNEGKKLYRLMPSLANGHQVDHLEQFFFLIC